MTGVITYDTLRSFAYSNDRICARPVRGMILTFGGLGSSGMQAEDDPLSVRFAEKGILHVVPYFNPWSWMNRQTVDFVDEIVSVLAEKLSFPDDLPIVSRGGSMGGLCALVYAAYARRTPAACVVNCPVCDLPFHYTERPDLPRTLYSAFGTYPGTLEEALRSASPVHLVGCLPDIPYTVFHCEEDLAVNKGRHSDVLVAAMQGRYRVEYISVPGRGHCDLPPEGWEAYHACAERAILE